MDLQLRSAPLPLETNDIGRVKMSFNKTIVMEAMLALTLETGRETGSKAKLLILPCCKCDSCNVFDSMRISS